MYLREQLRRDGRFREDLFHRLNVFPMVERGPYVSYANCGPMDCADATLVAVGETLGIRDVLTLDRTVFSVYR